jgi:hypothetical protein
MRSSGIIFLLLAGLISANFIYASETIDINSASLEELTEIIHIGEARGKELISLRPFYSLDDLDRINGISQGRVQDIKGQGLAWVDPALKTETETAEASLQSHGDQSPTTIDPELSGSNLEAVPKEELAKNKDGERRADSPPPLSIYLGAGMVAAFSGATILILKKKSKKEYNNIEL